MERLDQNMFVILCNESAFMCHRSFFRNFILSFTICIVHIEAVHNSRKLRYIRRCDVATTDLCSKIYESLRYMPEKIN